MQTHYSFFFFNDTATTEIYTLSLHDALPISFDLVVAQQQPPNVACDRRQDHLSSALMVTVNADDQTRPLLGDRKSTRLNSSHSQISYAVFCLKKKKNKSLAEYMLATAVPLVC